MMVRFACPTANTDNSEYSDQISQKEPSSFSASSASSEKSAFALVSGIGTLVACERGRSSRRPDSIKSYSPHPAIRDLEPDDLSSLSHELDRVVVAEEGVGEHRPCLDRRRGAGLESDQRVGRGHAVRRLELLAVVLARIRREQARCRDDRFPPLEHQGRAAAEQAPL